MLKLRSYFRAMGEAVKRRAEGLVEANRSMQRFSEICRNDHETERMLKLCAKYRRRGSFELDKRIARAKEKGWIDRREFLGLLEAGPGMFKSPQELYERTNHEKSVPWNEVEDYIQWSR